jgi:hypothetical protein
MFGLGTTLHVVPSHDSIRLFTFPEIPTATQSVADTHDTPLRVATLPDGVGLGTTDHPVPFQASVRP